MNCHCMEKINLIEINKQGNELIKNIQQTKTVLLA